MGLMAPTDLREFIQTLERAGELKRVKDEVDPVLEITEIADRSVKGGGPALLFENPRGSNIPVLINSMASMKRMELALGVDSVEDVAGRIAEMIQMKTPQGLVGKLKMLPKLAELGSFFPKEVRSGACQEVVRKDGFSLYDYPVLTCWPQDGGRFVTLPNVHTRDPANGSRNLGMYRMQVFNGRSTGMHWQVHKVAARHGKGYYERNEPMPVAVCLGGDPALTFAATAPLPDGLDEILLAGFMRKKGVPLIKCETSDIEVPADSDFVLEGYVQPGELRPEGPFGDHTGFYTPVDNYPVFHLTAITHRKAAIYPATIVGQPPMEDFYMGTASVRIFLPIFQMNFPEILDIALPAEGVFHNLVFVSIRKQYPYQAFKIMHGLWGMGQMMFAKYIVVVDEDCDVQNTSEVLFRLCANTDPERDSAVIRNPSDALDHAPTEPNVGSHMGFDATRKLPGEGYRRGWPELVKMDAEVEARLASLIAKLNPA